MLATLRMTADINSTRLNGTCFEDGDDQDIEEEDTTLYYFGGLFRRDEQERATFLENFHKEAVYWSGKRDDPSAAILLRAHLPTVLRLSVNAPFRDVREKATKILQELQVSIIKDVDDLLLVFQNDHHGHHMMHVWHVVLHHTV